MTMCGTTDPDQPAYGCGLDAGHDGPCGWAQCGADPPQPGSIYDEGEQIGCELERGHEGRHRFVREWD